MCVLHRYVKWIEMDKLTHSDTNSLQRHFCTEKLTEAISINPQNLSHKTTNSEPILITTEIDL